MTLSPKNLRYVAGADKARLREAERQAKARLEAYDVAHGIGETVALGDGRGEAFDVPKPPTRGKAQGPVRRVTGIEQLTRAGKLHGHRLDAAKAYRDAFQAANREPSLRSCLSDEPRGGAGVDVSKIGAAGRVRMVNQLRLNAMRVTLRQQTDLIMVCDCILGGDMTPRELARNGQEASVYTALLLVALDFLAVAWGEPESMKVAA